MVLGFGHVAVGQTEGPWLTSENDQNRLQGSVSHLDLGETGSRF